ncbi:hypothetical protein SAMN04488581_2337 [Mycolicibacterium neoaurum]|nr:hypothetical protein SAMN04488581_2337 [Mycolicibacterium neoaurum]
MHSVPQQDETDFSVAILRGLAPFPTGSRKSVDHFKLLAAQ